jgi:hypothetical protein
VPALVQWGAGWAAVEHVLRVGGRLAVAGHDQAKGHAAPPARTRSTAAHPAPH